MQSIIETKRCLTTNIKDWFPSVADALLLYDIHVMQIWKSIITMDLFWSVNIDDAIPHNLIITYRTGLKFTV